MKKKQDDARDVKISYQEFQEQRIKKKTEARNNLMINVAHNLNLVEVKKHHLKQISELDRLDSLRASQKNLEMAVKEHK